MVGGTNPGQVALGSVRKLAEQETMREVLKHRLPTDSAILPWQ